MNRLNKNYSEVEETVTSETTYSYPVSITVYSIELTATGIAYLDSIGLISYALEYNLVTNNVTASGYISGSYYIIVLDPADYVLSSSSSASTKSGTKTVTSTVSSLDYNLGWSGSAASVEGISGDGSASFSIKGDSVGIVIGFNEITDAATDSGFQDINTAVYFSKGLFRPMENGVQVGAAGTFLEADVFTLLRYNDTTFLFKNGTLHYTYTISASNDIVLDASLYSAGDAVLNAVIVNGVDESTASASGTATLDGPTLSNGSMTATATLICNIVSTSDGVIVLGGVTATATATIDAVVDDYIYSAPLSASATLSGTPRRGVHAGASVGGIATYGADRIRAGGSVSVGGIQTQGRDKNITIDVVSGSAVVGGVVTVGHSLTGGNSLNTSLSPCGSTAAFGADGILADGDSQCGGVKTRGGDYAEITDYCFGGIWKTTVLILGEELIPNTVNGTIWNTSLEAYGAGEVTGSIWTTTPTITGTLDITGQVTGSLWETTLTAEGFTGAAGEVNGKGWKSALTAYGAGEVSGEGWTLTLTATGTLGQVGSVTGSIWTTTVTITGTAPDNGIVTGGLWKTFSIYGDVTGSIWNTQLLADNRVLTSPSVAYAMNINTAETTEYTNYGFKFIKRFNGNYYGIKSDGLYLLEGTNDNGTIISAKVKTMMTDFGTSRHKRVPYAYVDGESDVSIRPYVEGEAKNAHYSKFGGRKVNLSRGNKGKNWEFELENVIGGDFVVQGLEVLEEILSRRV